MRIRPGPTVTQTALLAALTLAGCTVGGAGGGGTDLPPWPYAGVIALDRPPPELRGRSLFMGHWLSSAPDGESVFSEASNPRFVLQISWRDFKVINFLDLGAGAEVEALDFMTPGGNLMIVASLSSPHHERAVVARALLEVDADAGVLADVISISPQAISRGIAVDTRKRRVFLLEDGGPGKAEVLSLDLYGGRPLARAPIGAIPALVERKGLVLDRDARKLFCLAGGRSARGDFEPRTPVRELRPELIVFDLDTLGVVSRIALDADFTPAALAYDAQSDLLGVLEVATSRSRVVVVDAAFASVRARIDLPEPTTDLVLSGGYGFAPGPRGIYAVDLGLATWAGGTPLSFDLTREIAVSTSLGVALVMFRSTPQGGPPGIAAVALASGNVLDVLQ